jgi:tetratricopeptide (TPR) repeat protein
MILRRFVIFSLLAVFTMTSGARAVDRVKLRRAVRLPIVFAVIGGFYINDEDEFTIQNQEEPLPEQISALEKERKGDSTDATRYCRLASLYEGTSQPEKAVEARRKAVSLLRKQVEERPNDNSARLALATVLTDGGEFKEAETLFRKPVEECPKDYASWHGLGWVLNARSFGVLTGGKWLPEYEPNRLLQAMQAAAPKPEQFAQSRRDRDEAKACLDRAVALAPRDPGVYRKRGRYRAYQASLDAAVRMYHGEKVDLATVLFAADARQDYRRSVELAPDQYAGVGLVVLMETSAEAHQYALQNPSAKPAKIFDALSPSTQKRVREDVAGLEKGMQNPDKRKAAEAAEVLGALQALIDVDHAAAEKSLRQSLAFDPSRISARKALATVHVHAEDYRKAAELFGECLKQRDTPEIRILLAKAFEHLDQFDQAERVIRSGLSRHPDDVRLNLALLDLEPKKSEGSHVEQAEQILIRLEKARHLLEVDANLWANYIVACGVFYGLKGEMAIARERFEMVQKMKPDYPQVQEALKALDTPDEFFNPFTPQSRP